MTRQATLTRNKDGQLPIDLALYGDKQPWISVALAHVVPKLLETETLCQSCIRFKTWHCPLSILLRVHTSASC